MGGALTIRPVVAEDAAAIATLYAPYVRDTAISFEIEPPDTTEMARRIARVSARYPWIVAEMDGALAGYAYATELYERAAYRWVAESTIYLAPEMHGRGLGKALYGALLNDLRERGFLAAVGKVTLPNGPSVRLHEKMGFSQVGQLRAVGFKQGRWHDVGLYQAELAGRPDRPAEPQL